LMILCAGFTHVGKGVVKAFPGNWEPFYEWGIYLSRKKMTGDASSLESMGYLWLGRELEEFFHPWVDAIGQERFQAKESFTSRFRPELRKSGAGALLADPSGEHLHRTMPPR